MSEPNIQERPPAQYLAFCEYDPIGVSRCLHTAKSDFDKKASDEIISEDWANFLAPTRRGMALSTGLAVIGGEHAAERPYGNER